MTEKSWFPSLQCQFRLSVVVVGLDLQWDILKLQTWDCFVHMFLLRMIPEWLMYFASDFRVGEQNQLLTAVLLQIQLPRHWTPCRKRFLFIAEQQWSSLQKMSLMMSFLWPNLGIGAVMLTWMTWLMKMSFWQKMISGDLSYLVCCFPVLNIPNTDEIQFMMYTDLWGQGVADKLSELRGYVQRLLGIGRHIWMHCSVKAFKLF